ncbi:SagB/ThcOx family dehydrogenase [Nocardioides plantarum]|uniref:SagB family peptide dehydrogenase n=1 Tax=Nocardioides plantarum TaxID=29299 RepID=A0ABV5K723_9ACTN|nr:SagB family peptide dehydrogenase [Nocardioides plantarum]
MPSAPVTLAPPFPAPVTASVTVLRPGPAWRRGTVVRRLADGIAVGDETGTGSATVLRPLPAPLVDLLERMLAGPLDLEVVEEEIGPQGRTALELVLDRLGHRVARRWSDGAAQVVLAAEQTARGPWPAPVPVAAGDVVRLSRFALLRTDGDDLVLESPLGTTRFLVGDGVLARLVPLLGRARPVAELIDDESTDRVERAVLAHLVGAGVVERADVDGVFASATDPTLRQWDFHDLLMHSRVRSGRFDAVHGAAYPYVGEIDPLPARRPVPQGARVPLTRPDLAATSAADPTLTEVLEARRSIRDYGDEPMTVVQLGEFLYRTARVRAAYAPSDPTEEERVSRPYPSGGGSYELELFLTVRRCAGLEPGRYYYDPVDHALVHVGDLGRDAELMLNVASAATGLEARPDVLVTMTARFARVSWKYRSIAYATTLRHTGVAYQTMYLVATAMGLAPCALGNGDADLAARAFGLDYLRESSVGDFILGSRPSVDAAAVSGDAGLAPGWSLLNDGAWTPTG